MYSIGAGGVKVAAIVGSNVGRGVLVLVGVSVTVGVTVGVVTLPVVCRIRKTSAAPRPNTRITNPIAAGKLNLSSGSFGP